MRYPYDVTADGHRFLVIEQIKSGATGIMTLTLDWTEMLRR